MKFKATHIKPFGMLIEAKHPVDAIQDFELGQLRTLFRKEHLVVLRGFRTYKDSDDFSKYCERWGEVSVWPFGKVLELIERENPEDHIFDSNYVPLHWDGMYRPQVPEYQIFHCVQAPLPGQGGRTTFSNTMLALESADPHIKRLWSQATGVYQRKMEFYNSKTISPIVTMHPHRGYPVIRYSEPPSKEHGHFVNPPDLTFSGVEGGDIELLHQSLKEALYSPNNFYAHEWQTGDVIIADNFSLLHGREKFVSKAPRYLQRVHVLSEPPVNNPGLESYQ